MDEQSSIATLPPMTDQEFGRLSRVIQEVLGIRMPLSKKLMLQARLMRRMRILGLPTYAAYCDYLLRPGGDEAELTQFLDLATTNKTSFFRESEHFRYMTQYALPDLVERPEVRMSRRLNLWSAACSTGQEPYTLAMVVSDFLTSARLSDWDFTVRATDISTRVLAAAKLGVYLESEVEPVPPALRQRYLLRGKGEQRGTVRVVKALRDKVQFERVNLMARTASVRQEVHVVMCRNALIYFERDDQRDIVDNLSRHLVPAGYLILGMSESIHGCGLPLAAVGRSVYRPDASAGR